MQLSCSGVWSSSLAYPVLKSYLFEAGELTLQLKMKSSDAEIATASVLFVDAEGVVIAVEENVCTALGWTRETLLNQPISEALEYGHDLVMNCVTQLNDESIEQWPDGLPVSTLVRRSDQTNFPATIIVRRVPDLGCFSLTFDDLAIAETAQEVDVAPAQDPEPVIEELSRDVPEPRIVINGDGPRFRNVFLNGAMRAGSEPKLEAPIVVVKELKEERSVVNGSEDFAAQLKTEREERRRLESRVLSLNTQLQQLHAQLKSNLESENIYQKRVLECEEELQKAEQLKVAAEVALVEEKQRGARLEEAIDRIKADFAVRDDERRSWQQEWLAKLEVNLSALQESDARFAKEIATRRGIDVTLQMLRQDFCAESKKQEGVAIPKYVNGSARVEFTEAAGE